MIDLADKEALYPAWEKRTVHTRSMTRHVRNWFDTFDGNPPWLINQWMATGAWPESDANEERWHSAYCAAREQWASTTWLGYLEEQVMTRWFLLWACPLWLWVFGAGGAGSETIRREIRKHLARN